MQTKPDRLPTTLHCVAHVRAGDKRNISNVAVIAYDKANFAAIQEQLTADAVLAFYKGEIEGPCTRYVVEPLGVLNFVLDGALGGGVSRTLKLDNHGKSLGAALLAFPIDVPGPLHPTR